MIDKQSILQGSPEYIKRRILWKATNRVRATFVRTITRMWERQMRKYLDGDIFAISNAMRITYVEVGGKFARFQNNKIKTTKALGDINDSFDRQLATYADTKMSSISASIGDNLRAKADILETEEEIDDLIKARAKIVSSNEVTRSSNVGIEIGATAAALLVGDPLVKTWIATIDDRVRDGHESADGQTVKNNETFNVTGESLRFPQDPSGSVANTINCRCVLDYQRVKNFN